MNKSPVSFFLPARKGSQRVKNKNTRPFAGISGGLLANKLRQLAGTTQLDEIVFSTNDEECLSIAEPFAREDSRIHIVIRPDELCLDSTGLSDLIAYVPSVVSGEHVLWGHVTTPMVGADMYDRAVELYFDGLREGFDSLVSVVEFRNFLLDGNGIQVNNTTGILWPRTQDLAPLYEINHALFMAPTDTYVRERNRVGARPKMLPMDKIVSWDVDWEEDFKMAEVIFGQFFGKETR